MVDCCDLAFRILTRRHGCNLCYTAMMHSRLLIEDPGYMDENFQTCEEDHPLTCQLNGNNPEYLLKASQKLEPFCEAIDLNLGCPQGIAKRGCYGAYLLPKYDIIEQIVKRIVPNIHIAFTAKIRLLCDFNDTIRLVKMLEREGCQLITVHGRTKEQNKDKIGSCDWNKIKAVKESVNIPVFANGGIECYEDIQRCIDYTHVDGVMIGEAILENPAICTNGKDIHGNPIGVDDIVNEYLDLASVYPPHPSEIRNHLFKILYRAFQYFPEKRSQLALNPLNTAESLLQVRDLVKELREAMNSRGDSWVLTDCTQCENSWYLRHRNINGPETDPRPRSVSSSSSDSDVQCGNLFGFNNDDDDDF
ncbi:hypothetical protein WA158_005052 [Blastocystis sp. Blastoise]